MSDGAVFSAELVAGFAIVASQQRHRSEIGPTVLSVYLYL